MLRLRVGSLINRKRMDNKEGESREEQRIEHSVERIENGK